VVSKKNARTFMEEQELCREFHKTGKITFGMSELEPGAVGGLDKGHSEADEIFYCIQGEVICHFPEENHDYRLKAGDSLLIPPANGHKLTNVGQETAIIIWACAPHP
jgi:mannose-6-phosphate isomerase-like protein (cupin superfamily)